MQKLIFTSKIRLFLLKLFTAVLIVSCEGISGGSGFILTTKDNTPVDSAQIILLSNGKPIDTAYTDNDGKFQIRHLVGCVPKCPESRLVITKNGYQTLDFNMKKENEKNQDFRPDSLKIFLTPEIK